MGILATAVAAQFATRSWLSGDAVLARLFDPPATAAGVAVTLQAVLGLPAVRRAIDLIASTAAGLPLGVYQRQPNGARERVQEDPLDDRLNYKANPHTTAMVFREQMLFHLLVHGRSYSEVVRDSMGRPRELWLLDPRTVTPIIEGPVLRYRVVGDNGAPVVLDQAHMLDVPGSVDGRSVVMACRDAFALAIAQEKHGSAFFKNSARPGGFLSTPARLSPASREHLRTSIQALHGGVENAHKLAILEEGLAWTPTGFTNEASEWLGAREFSIVEIARIFGVPPVLIAGSAPGSLTYANAEMLAAFFLRYGLLPWLRRIETAVNAQLIDAVARQTRFVEHVVDGLLRSDNEARARSYTLGITGGWLSANDIRRMENLSPIPGGDVYGRPVATAPPNGAGPGRGDHLSVLAVRRLVEDQVRRSLEREASRARKAATSISGLEAWALGYYVPSEAAGLAGALETAIAAAATAQEPATLARSVADEMHAESQRDLAALAHSGPADVQAAVASLTESWVRHRPKVIADQLFVRIAP
jgi:HK97 family phage portal protein